MLRVMTSHGSDDRRLAALHAPRRNRYFFGKLLGVADLEMEQDYVRLPAEPPPIMEVRLCYEARAADAAPALAGDDEGSPEAGTWVEGYGLEIREATGTAAATAESEEATLELVRAGRISEALAALARTACASPVSDPGVTLATIAAGADGELTVDPHTARAVVPTNLMLLKLIAGLAAHVDECWAASTATAAGDRPGA